MEGSNHTKMGAYCSLALHATVTLAVLVSMLAKTIFKMDEPPAPPTVFDMVEPATEIPMQTPAPAPMEQAAEIEPPKIDKIEPLEMSKPEPMPEPESTPEPTPKPSKKPDPKPTPKLSKKHVQKLIKKSKPKKRVSYAEFLKKNPDKRRAKPTRRSTSTKPVKVGKITANVSNLSGIANISASAMTGSAMKSELSAYTQYIHALAKRNWVPPQNVYETLATEISFNISKTGAISNVRIVKSSGNKAFDNSIVATFKAISLIPPPDNQPHTVSLTFRAD